jgi:hypothetical protein
MIARHAAAHPLGTPLQVGEALADARRLRPLALVHLPVLSPELLDGSGAPFGRRRFPIESIRPRSRGSRANAMLGMLHLIANDTRLFDVFIA